MTGLSLMWCLWLRPPGNLERYFWAQLAYIPLIWAAHQLWDDESWPYALVYCLLTAPILYCCARIALDCIRTRQWKLRVSAIALIMAAIPTRIAFLDAREHFSGYLALALAEAFVLVWAAVLGAFAARYTGHRWIYYTLATVWVVQAFYDYLWVMYRGILAAWNWTIPPATGLVGFSVLALLLSLPPRLAEHSPPSSQPAEYRR